MRCAIDEIGESDQRCGKANHGAIERCDQDFGVCGKNMCDMKIIGNERLKALASNISTGGRITGDRDISTAVRMSIGAQ